jgi:hypothetical protein
MYGGQHSRAFFIAEIGQAQALINAGESARN